MDDDGPGKRGMTGRLGKSWKDVAGTAAIIGLVLLLIVSPLYLLYLLLSRRAATSEPEGPGRDEQEAS